MLIILTFNAVIVKFRIKITKNDDDIWTILSVIFDLLEPDSDHD